MAFISTLITVGGGLLGASMNKKGSNATEAKNEPWAAAKPYLERNLATNQQLQDYYSQNPFNGLQQQGYENLFGDQNNFRQNIAPGLMQFANNGMNSNYQRRQHEQPGQAGYGLLSSPQQGQQTGLLAPFSVSQTKPYAVGNLNVQSPFYQSPESVAAAAAKLAEEERLKKLQQSQQPTYDQSASSNWNAGYGA